jgi:hypothetical protein
MRELGGLQAPTQPCILTYRGRFFGRLHPQAVAPEAEGWGLQEIAQPLPRRRVVAHASVVGLLGREVVMVGWEVGGCVCVDNTKTPVTQVTTAVYPPHSPRTAPHG